MEKIDDFFVVDFNHGNFHIGLDVFWSFFHSQQYFLHDSRKDAPFALGSEVGSDAGVGFS